MKAVITAAGLGTRLLPATRVMPKEMMPVVDTPVIQFVVEEAFASGILDLLVITRRGKSSIEEYLDCLCEGDGLSPLSPGRGIRNLGIHYIFQANPRGLGDAVLQAKMHVGSEPFALMLADEIFRSAVPCIEQLIKAHERVGGSVVAVKEVPLEDTARYGVIDPVLPQVVPGLFRVKGLVEKPGPEAAPSNMAIVGRYVLESEVFGILEQSAPGASGEIQLTDALEVLVKEGRQVHAMVVQGSRYDTGNRFGLLKATIEHALARQDMGESFLQYLRGLLVGN